MKQASDELLPELCPILDAWSLMSPGAASGARRTLALFCRPWIEQLKRGLPLHESLLTPGGYPLEFAFSSGSQNVAYAAEPGLAQASVRNKWRFVCRYFPDLGGRSHPLLRALRSQRLQRFGCWLGVRHIGCHFSLKVYQEVGPAARELVLYHLRSQVPGLTDACRLRPTLLGVSKDRAEYYCEAVGAGPAMLHRVFTAVCRAKALPSVIDCVAHLAAEQRSKLWQRLRIGISYAVARGRAPELTLFLDSGQLFRDDLQARTRILGLLNQLGQPMPVYENFTSRLAERPPSVPVHGLVGLKAADSGRIDCSVGVRPFA